MVFPDIFTGLLRFIGDHVKDQQQIHKYQELSSGCS